MKWFKFYGQDWLTDLKVINMPIEDRLCFITLLCLASTSEEKGKIRNCSEETVIRLTQLDDNAMKRVTGVIKRLHDNGMITSDNTGCVSIKNFVSRQGENLTSYERVKKYREKQSKAKNKVIKKEKSVINDNVDDNANDNARREENRIEENIYIDTKNSNKLFFEQDQEYETLLAQFSQGKDANWVRSEFNKFVLYWTEPNRTGKKQRWELQTTFDVKRRLVTWFSNKNNYSKPQGRGLAQ
jgi:hypothetical protein